MNAIMPFSILALIWLGLTVGAAIAAAIARAISPITRTLAQREDGITFSKSALPEFDQREDPVTPSPVRASRKAPDP